MLVAQSSDVGAADRTLAALLVDGVVPCANLRQTSAAVFRRGSLHTALRALLHRSPQRHLLVGNRSRQLSQTRFHRVRHSHEHRQPHVQGLLYSLILLRLILE